MINQTAEVKSHGEVVGVAEFPEFESVSEAVENLGESDILELINTQVKTSAMNATRQEATADQRKPTKKDLEAVILNATAEQFTKIQGILSGKKIDDLDADAIKELGAVMKEVLQG